MQFDDNFFIVIIYRSFRLWNGPKANIENYIPLHPLKLTATENSPKLFDKVYYKISSCSAKNTIIQ